jgi:DNA-binding response OmpR family regulator
MWIYLHIALYLIDDLPTILRQNRTRITAMKNKILCIEDNPTIQTLVQLSLQEYDVTCAASLHEAETQLLSHTYAALLIDIQLPDGDGLRFLAQLSQKPHFKNIPILIFSNYSEISNKVAAFTLGADDFIAKPFDPIELNIRITAKIRKKNSESEQQKTRSLGDLLIDFDRQKVFLLNSSQELDLELTSIEIKILALLTKRLEQVYSREQILQSVWGSTSISDRTIDSHVAHLRQKIKNSQLQIETAKSFGYRAALR